MATADLKKTSITFHFQPFQFGEKNHAIEKADGSGKKCRYLQGVSSGLNIDAHQERMTGKCIKSFMDQANSGNILLYPDIHGIKASEDIGILTKATIQDNGDWHTEYRLYDDQDDVDSVSKEKAKKIWNQINGLPPYKRPMQKGFSIEGYVPEDGILFANKDQNGNMSNRIIDNVLLDGVVLVPRPAYKDSVAHAVYKALGEIAPWNRESLAKAMKSEFTKLLENENLENQFFRKRWDLQDALDKAIKKIMIRNKPEKEQEIGIVFDEYKNLMIQLIMNSAPLFQEEEGEQNSGAPYGSGNPEVSKSEIFKDLIGQLVALKKIIGGTKP